MVSFNNSILIYRDRKPRLVANNIPGFHLKILLTGKKAKNDSILIEFHHDIVWHDVTSGLCKNYDSLCQSLI